MFALSLADPNNRVAPSEPKTHRNDGQGYVISPARLAEIRRHFMYWFFDQGGDNNRGDYQTDIHASMPQLHKNFNFQLPFFGFRFNYTRVSTPHRFPHDECNKFNNKLSPYRFLCMDIWNFPIHQSILHTH